MVYYILYPLYSGIYDTKTPLAGPKLWPGRSANYPAKAKKKKDPLKNQRPINQKPKNQKPKNRKIKNQKIKNQKIKNRKIKERRIKD